MGLSNFKPGDSVWVNSPVGAFEGNVSRKASSRSGFVRVDPLDPDIIPGVWPEALVSSRRPNVQDEIEIDDEVVDSFGNPGVVYWIENGLTGRYILVRYPDGKTHRFAERAVTRRSGPRMPEFKAGDAVVLWDGRGGVVEDWDDSQYLVRVDGNVGSGWYARGTVGPAPLPHEEPSDPVQSPSHYDLRGGLKVIDIVRDESFLRGNVIKYVLRAPHKQNELEDMKKALRYLTWEIERLENE